MTRGQSRRTAWLLTLAAATAAGCVSLKRSPVARFYVLAPVASPAEAGGHQRPQAEPALVGVLQARVPAWLDRPQLVTRSGGHGVHVDEQARWAEPLGRGVTRTLAENLARLLPDHQVSAHPWERGRVPSCRVEVELADFSRSGAEAFLAARWALLAGRDGPVLARGRSEVVEPVPGAGDEAGVAALSAALGRLAAEIARTAAGACSNNSSL